MDQIEELRYLVLAAQRDGSRRLAEALRPLDVTSAQAEVLTILASASQPLSVKELGAQLVCEPGSPSRLTRTITAAGLAELSADPADARVTRVTLTPQGRAKASAIAEIERGFHEELRSVLPDSAELDGLIATLRQLAEAGPSGQALARRREAENKPK